MSATTSPELAYTVYPESGIDRLLDRTPSPTPPRGREIFALSFISPVVRAPTPRMPTQLMGWSPDLEALRRSPSLEDIVRKRPAQWADVPHAEYKFTDPLGFMRHEDERQERELRELRERRRRQKQLDDEAAVEAPVVPPKPLRATTWSNRSAPGSAAANSHALRTRSASPPVSSASSSNAGGVTFGIRLTSDRERRMAMYPGQHDSPDLGKPVTRIYEATLPSNQAPIFKRPATPIRRVEVPYANAPPPVFPVIGHDSTVTSPPSTQTSGFTSPLLQTPLSSSFADLTVVGSASSTRPPSPTAKHVLISTVLLGETMSIKEMDPPMLEPARVTTSASAKGRSDKEIVLHEFDIEQVLHPSPKSPVAEVGNASARKDEWLRCRATLEDHVSSQSDPHDPALASTHKALMDFDVDASTPKVARTTIKVAELVD